MELDFTGIRKESMSLDLLLFVQERKGDEGGGLNVLHRQHNEMTHGKRDIT